MAAWSIPQVFFREWFWAVIWLPLLVIIFAIRYYRGRVLPPPQPHPFFLRHKRAIRLASDIFIICILSGMVAFVIRISVPDLSRALHEDGFMRRMDLRFAWLSFCGGMTIASTSGGALVGMLSVFQSSITIPKRIFLLVFSLLPVAFVVPSLAGVFSELGWRTIPLGVLICAPSWVVNGPAILTGQPLVQVMWWIMCKLRLASGDYRDWW